MLAVSWKYYDAWLFSTTGIFLVVLGIIFWKIEKNDILNKKFGVVSKESLGYDFGDWMGKKK